MFLRSSTLQGAPRSGREGQSGEGRAGGLDTDCPNMTAGHGGESPALRLFTHTTELHMSNALKIIHAQFSHSYFRETRKMNNTFIPKMPPPQQGKSNTTKTGELAKENNFSFKNRPAASRTTWKYFGTRKRRDERARCSGRETSALYLHNSVNKKVLGANSRCLFQCGIGSVSLPR